MFSKYVRVWSYVNLKKAESYDTDCTEKVLITMTIICLFNKQVLGSDHPNTSFFSCLNKYWPLVIVTFLTICFSKDVRELSWMSHGVMRF